ncbi:ultra-long-chain fatty acid omega-hydroxylase-like [Branchiostoma lanceolatum]|uniref:ultra-long-chain fatty acid omega-hydroxylase-like n=1 Tax=Branchiostoma lanceolatum TaxID=7740 RepID=UPI0034539488
MVASSEDEQSQVFDVLRLVSAGLPAGVTGTALVVWTLVGILAVRLSVYVVNFIAWQAKFRRAMKQFPLIHRPAAELLSLDHNDRSRVHWQIPIIAFTYCGHPETVKPILSNIILNIYHRFRQHFPEIYVVPPTVMICLSARKPEWMYRFFRPWLGDGLLVSEGSKWQRNRRLLTPAFHFDILKHYVKLFSESADVLLEKWMSRGPGASMELFDDVGLMTLDNILKCSLGYNSSCQTDGRSSPYILAVHDLTRLLNDRPDYLPYYVDFIYYLSADGRRFRKACKIVHDFSEKVIRERKEQLKKGEFTFSKTGRGKRLDLLDILLRARDEDGTGLSVSEIQDEVNTFLFGGHHTTASGISWTLFHLAQNMDYQDKCRREVEEVLQDRTEITWQDVGKLPFITMCIKESMRCVPPVPRVARALKQDLTFPDGKSLPKGSPTYAEFNELHRNSDIWPNPTVYDPYRFSPENSLNRHPYAFLPFSAGPRNCIGQNFAMSEMKVSVALILRRFHLELDGSKPPVVPCEMITNQTTDGIWVKAHPVKTD